MSVWFSVAFGGALGAMARYGLTQLFPLSKGQFPAATFIANTLGCFLMGAIYLFLMQKQLIPETWRPFLAVGFLGAFTTFSTFSLEALLLWQSSHFTTAVVYLLATLFATIAAVIAGYSLAAMLFK